MKLKKLIKQIKNDNKVKVFKIELEIKSKQPFYLKQFLNLIKMPELAEWFAKSYYINGEKVYYYYNIIKKRYIYKANYYYSSKYFKFNIVFVNIKEEHKYIFEEIFKLFKIYLNLKNNKDLEYVDFNYVLYKNLEFDKYIKITNKDEQFFEFYTTLDADLLNEIKNLYKEVNKYTSLKTKVKIKYISYYKIKEHDLIFVIINFSINKKIENEDNKQLLKNIEYVVKASNNKLIKTVLSI